MKVDNQTQRASKSQQETERIIEKIRKLLALGTSHNEAEAALAMEKAHELLANYNLALADLGPAQDEVQEQEIASSGRMASWKSLLISAVARVNYCTVLRRRLFGAGNKLSSQLCLVGRVHNMVAAQVMLEYLFEAVGRLCAQYQKTKHEGLSSYRSGLCTKLYARLEAVALKEQQPGSAVHALVVSERGAVDAYLRGLGSIRTTKIRQSIADLGAYKQGHQDGDSVLLNKQLDKRTARSMGLLGDV